VLHGPFPVAVDRSNYAFGRRVSLRSLRSLMDKASSRTARREDSLLAPMPGFTPSGR
jgi:hypothetical protein